MNGEFEPQEIATSRPPGTPERLVHDAKWFPRFKECGIFDDYEYFRDETGEREQERSRFLAGEVENPELNYSVLANFDFDGHEQGLLQLKTDVLRDEPNEWVRKAYHWRINEKIATLRMMKAARDGDDRRFSHYSHFIYGRPDPEVWNYTLGQIEAKVQKGIDHPEEAIRTLAQELIEKVQSLYQADARRAQPQLP